MQKQSFMRADEVAQELGISKSHAYKVIHGLNEELQEKGYLTISGRVNREFFREMLSMILGLAGVSCLWSIRELQEQVQRVEKGWFPKNPNRKEPMDCTK